MFKVGITGGIGSGKSLVCELFKLLGVPVYHADLEAKKMYDTNSDLVEAIVLHFGASLRTPEGRVDRKALAAIVFKDSNALETINQLVHPLVAQHFEQWCKRNSAHAYVIKEAAILFESNSYLQMDRIITVTAPVDQRIQRTVLRDAVSAQQVQDRISKQYDDVFKASRSNWVLVNDGTQLLIPEVYKIHRSLVSADQ